MKIKIETTFFVLLIISIVMISVWNIVFQLSNSDPKIELKYDIAINEIRQSKNAVIAYYCNKGRFPLTLDDLVPETINHLPRDPWGNNYMIESLSGSLKGSGISLLSMGGDGKSGGKAWKMDIIARVDIKEINCEKTPK